MIHWLMQVAADHPDLARGGPPPGVFSPAELQRLEQFRFEKRRREWLLGRWTAKQLLCGFLRQRLGLEVALTALVVAREPGGAPLAVLDAEQAPLASRLAGPLEQLPLIGAAGARPDGPLPTVVGVRLPASLSISHSNGAAFCALLPLETALADQRIGADIERIEARSQQFQATFLTSAEQYWIARAGPGLADALVTATWSAKESALKALQVGLTVDVRRVAALCAVEGDLAPWQSVQIDCDEALLARPMASFGVSTPGFQRLSGWWRVEGDYVLTLALLEGGWPAQRPTVEKESHHGKIHG